eukprot:m.16240 g.16240  ORF g.16240 m.16240 type:complete len:359 (+) comp5192_c0_seq1:82-1158(+)
MRNRLLDFQSAATQQQDASSGMAAGASDGVSDGSDAGGWSSPASSPLASPATGRKASGDANTAAAAAAQAKKEKKKKSRRGTMGKMGRLLAVGKSSSRKDKDPSGQGADSEEDLDTAGNGALLPHDDAILAEIEASRSLVHRLEENTVGLQVIFEKWVQEPFREGRAACEAEMSRSFSVCLQLQKKAVDAMERIRDMPATRPEVLAAARNHAQYLLGKVNESDKRMQHVIRLRDARADERSEMLASLGLDSSMQQQLRMLVAEDTKDRAAERHRQCLALEEQLIHLRDLMAQVATFVAQQQDQLDNIELNVSNAGMHVEASLEPLRQASRFNRLARHKKVMAYATTAAGVAVTAGLLL